MSYRVYVSATALEEAKRCPGHVRQRIKQAFRALANTPRPSDSKSLDWPITAYEARRLRIGDWRIIYAVNDQDHWVEVVAVRKRPPYDYGDLAQLLSRLG